MVESWKKRSTQQKAVSKANKKLPKGSAIEAENDTPTQNDQFSLSLQQALLDMFRDACVMPLEVEIDTTLQEVKGHLYNRDFTTAFGKDEYLQAYAARWSPSRALAYAQVFSDISCYFLPEGEDKVTSMRSLDKPRQSSDQGRARSRTSSISRIEGDSAEITALVSSLTEHVKHAWRSSISSRRSNQEPSGDLGAADADVHIDDQSIGKQADPPIGGGRASISTEEPSRLQAPPFNDRLTNFACLGGGAGAEIVGLAGWIKSMMGRQESSSTAEAFPSYSRGVDVLNVDVAAWDKVVESLDHRIKLPPVLSAYASAAAKAANSAFLPPEALNVRFKQQDILEMESSEIAALLGSMDIVTIMFTLNELYTASVSKSQRLLLEITACMQPGTHLLVVDSPGSYSSVVINGAEKKYPMQWLLDHTLLDEDRATRTTKWEKLVSDESRWFRIPKGLKYPIELENMRYQIHLYRRL